MSTIAPKDNLITDLMQKGLNKDEAAIVYEWVKDGKPGLAKTRAEHLGEIYVLGYSCQELHKWFPEFPLPLLLWARMEYKWDELREAYRQTVYEQTLKSALTTRVESLRFLSDYLSATHKSWQKELMEYMGDPDPKKKAPEFLPRNIHVYSQALAMFENMLKFDKKTGKDANPMEGMPLVAISVNQDSSKNAEVEVTNVTQEDVKKALLGQVKLRKSKDG